MFQGAVVVMGVTSSGKSTVGEALARELGVPFIEGDALHPEANVAKMSAGTPLTDEDRWPWLQKIGEELAKHKGAVASCSALKRVYRQTIAVAAGRSVSFVHLHGSKELLASRMSGRKGHFMPLSLLDSQLATLEIPQAGEPALTLDIAAPVDELVAKAKSFLMAVSHSGR
jgi:carbohydrate kinase (thermoresistant glucokinase family)